MQSSSNVAHPSHSEIAALAEKIYLQSGCIPGRDVENWLLAEAKLKEQKLPKVEAGEPKQQLSQKRESKLKQPNQNQPKRSQLAATH